MLIRECFNVVVEADFLLRIVLICWCFWLIFKKKLLYKSRILWGPCRCPPSPPGSDALSMLHIRYPNPKFQFWNSGLDCKQSKPCALILQLEFTINDHIEFSFAVRGPDEFTSNFLSFETSNTQVCVRI